MHCMRPEPTVDLLLLARLALLQIALPSFLPWPLVSHGLFGQPAAQVYIGVLTIASHRNRVLPWANQWCGGWTNLNETICHN